MKNSILLIIILSVLYSCTMSPEEIERERIYKIQKEIHDLRANESRIRKKDSTLFIKLNNEINLLKKPFDNSNYNGSVPSLQMELAVFKTWGSLISAGERSKISKNNKQALVLKNKVRYLQIKEFPIIRKRYSKILKKLMWEHDIEVSISGRGNRIINITGGKFAANRNKQSFQEKMSNIFKEFRFTQVRYRWIKSEVRYTFYDMEVPKDSEEI